MEHAGKLIEVFRPVSVKVIGEILLYHTNEDYTLGTVQMEEGVLVSVLTNVGVWVRCYPDSFPDVASAEVYMNALSGLLETYGGEDPLGEIVSFIETWKVRGGH